MGLPRSAVRGWAPALILALWALAAPALAQEPSARQVEHEDTPAGGASVESGESKPSRTRETSFCRGCSRVSSGFGRRSDPITRRRRFHEGVDISRPAGTEVFAWRDGVVLRAGRKGRYGLTVDIRHDDGMVSRYAHLKKATVAAGQTVETGQHIGLVGRTGRTTGANLHFEVTQNGRRRDPNRLGIDFSRLVGPLPHPGDTPHPTDGPAKQGTGEPAGPPGGAERISGPDRSSAI